MSRFTYKQRKELARENAMFSQTLVQIPQKEWPDNHPPGLMAVYRSYHYLVQVFTERGCNCRISVCRTVVKGGSWADKIPWDDLQRIKSEVGLGDFMAVEIYPRECDLVNEVSMRHLFVVAVELPFGWKKNAA